MVGGGYISYLVKNLYMKRFLVSVLFLLFSFLAYSQKYTSNEVAIFPDFNLPDHRSLTTTTNIEVTPKKVFLSNSRAYVTVVVLEFNKKAEFLETSLFTYKALINSKPVVIGYSYNKAKALVTLGILEGKVLTVFIIDQKQDL